MTTAKAVQEARDTIDYARAIENIAWLSEPNPKFSCDTPVTRSDIVHLMALNKQIAGRLEKKGMK